MQISLQGWRGRTKGRLKLPLLLLLLPALPLPLPLPLQLLLAMPCLTCGSSSARTKWPSARLRRSWECLWVGGGAVGGIGGGAAAGGAAQTRPLPLRSTRGSALPSSMQQSCCLTSPPASLPLPMPFFPALMRAAAAAAAAARRVRARPWPLPLPRALPPLQGCSPPSRLPAPRCPLCRCCCHRRARRSAAHAL